MALLGATGCHSAFVEATIVNQTGAPLRLVELDYPSASFGKGELANGATFRYRFKVLGTGTAKLTWTDPHEKELNSAGPVLREGDEGPLAVTIGADGAHWSSDLHAIH
ncbi:MAG: hypothetical protein ACRYFU_12250 [Janthinobacterium lividum]